MAYEHLLLQALSKGDMERVKAIQRLNTPGSYSYGKDRVNDEMVALHGIRYDGTHTKSY